MIAINVAPVSAAERWTFFDVPKSAASSRGHISDLLSEFASDEAKQHLTIRCTDPNKDGDINTRANGEFIAHRGEEMPAQHLCFPASHAYNSWVCYWTMPGGLEPTLSFVQLNAD